MFEEQILSKFLPINFHQLENFTTPLSYSPVIEKQRTIQFKNKHREIVQEGKRTWLNIFLNVYEVKLEEYEQQYQNEFLEFEKTTQVMNQTTTATTSLTLLDHIKQYMISKTNKLKQDIYGRMSSFRDKLIQNRQRSSTAKNTIGVSPEPYLDLLQNPFHTCEWNQLSLGKKHSKRKPFSIDITF